MSNVIQFEEVIKQSGPRFARMRTNHEIKFATECMFALELFRKSPKLRQCSEASVQSSMMDLAAVGLSLNPALRHAYLIPRKKNIGTQEKPSWETICCLSISYIGEKHIAEESGAVRTVWADVIYDNDEWEYESGSEPKLYHKPLLTGERGTMVAAYAVAILNDGTKHITLVPKEKIDRVRAFSDNPDGKHSPWTNWPEEMEKKTAVHQGAKYWPRTERFAKAIDVASAADGLLTGPPKPDTLARVQTAALRKIMTDAGYPKARVAAQMKLLALSFGVTTASKIPAAAFDEAKGKVEAGMEKWQKIRENRK